MWASPTHSLLYLIIKDIYGLCPYISFLFLKKAYYVRGSAPDTLPLFVKSGAKTSYIGSVKTITFSQTSLPLLSRVALPRGGLFEKSALLKPSKLLITGRRGRGSPKRTK